MITNKLWELPILSSELEDEVKFEIVNTDATLILNHDSVSIKIKFETALCHLHTSERFTKSILGAYDAIVEIEESEWIKELEELNSSDVEFWNLKHYVLYIEKMGLYQFIAEKYEVDLEEKSDKTNGIE
jgi:hypothetical protein